MVKRLCRGCARLARRLRSSVSPLFLAAVAGVSLSGGIGIAYAMTVHDPTNNAVLLDQLSEARKALEAAQDQLRELERSNQLVGQLGALPLDFEAGPLQEAGRVGCMLETFRGFTLPDGVEMPSIRSVCQAKRFFQTYFTATAVDGNMVDGVGAEEIRLRRDQAAEEAALHALALGMSEREASTTSMGRVASLTASVSASGTLREDMANNNRILLEILSELKAMRTLLAAQTEVAGADVLGASPLVVRPREPGTLGTTPPPGQAPDLPGDPFAGMER